MKRKSFKKLIALLIAASTLLACVGCGQQSEDKEVSSEMSSEAASTQATEESSETEKVEEPAEKDTLTLFVAERYVEDFETNYFTQVLEERANVDLEFISVPRDEYWTKFNLMVNGGEKLPDIVVQNKLESVYEYGSAGIFVPLNEYLNDSQAMPNFNTNIPAESRDIVIGGVTEADGNIYAAPSYQDGGGAGKNGNHGSWINMDWLEAVGMDVPKTTDELYNVLKAFKEKDPNGNGKADEIPAIGALKGETAWYIIMNSFLYMQNQTAEYVNLDENENVYAAFTTNEWKSALEYLNKLVSEELLVSVSFTQDTESFDAILASQPVGVYYSGLYANNEEEMYNYQPLAPLTGPEGKNYITAAYSLPQKKLAITRDCENMDAAIRLLDAFYDLEVSMISRLGEPEVDWSRTVPEGYVSGFATSNTPDEPTYVDISGLWGVVNNKHWTNYNPFYLAEDYYGKGILLDESATDFATEKQRQGLAVQRAYEETGEVPEKVITLLNISEGDATEYKDLTTSIYTYVEESIVRFATGDLPMSEWDNYLKTLEGMGIERWLEIIQDGYDAYVDSVK